MQIKETDAAAEDESSGNKKEKAQDESGGEDYSDDDFDWFNSHNLTTNNLIIESFLNL